MSKLKLNLSGQNYNIGDNVIINWSKKDYLGKSVRRKVIDSIMQSWRNNPSNSLALDVDERYYFDSSKKTLKIFSDIINKKKSCHPSVFKFHDEAKDWFKNIVECIDNIQGAIITGVHAKYHHASNICPSNVCYVTGTYKPLYIYTVMIHGLCDVGNRNNHVQFEVELIDSDIEGKH